MRFSPPPLLVLMGLPLQNVVALVSTCSMTQAMPVGNRLSRETLRRLAYGLLLFIGLSTILRTLYP